MKKFLLITIYIILSYSVIYSQQLWFTENSGTTMKLNKIRSSPTNYNLFACGEAGVILGSTNNGLNWTMINTGFNYNINDINISSNSIVAVCDGGKIIRSTNYGSSWAEINSGISYDINSIIKPQSSSYFAACGNGIILKSTDNGLNWTIHNAASVSINSITYASGLLFACGNNGLIIRSSNNGLNWTALNTGTNKNINCIFRRSLSTDSSLYACGSDGLFLRTYNYGNNWESINTGFNFNFTSVTVMHSYVSNSDKIYLSASQGKVISTSDSGASWILDYNGNIPLNDINDRASRAVGDNGLILYRYKYEHWISFKNMDANNISTVFTNYCEFNRNVKTGNSGFEWPKGSNKFARLASGLWLGAQVEDDTLIAMSHYASEFYPGYTDNSGNPNGKFDTLNRVYKILADINDYDRTKWPNALLGNSDQGAPVFFDNSSGTWKPLDFGWQTMFTRFTDSYPESHHNNASSTAPLKADIKMISYAFSNSGALDNTIITRYTIINRSSNVWNNLFIGFWTNDDLGDAFDNLSACDTNLNLGYVYNGDNYDNVYGSGPPAVGTLLLKGTSVYTGNNSDTSWICNAKNRINKIGFKDRKMDVFNWYANAGPTWGDPQYYYQTYRMLNGLGKQGTQIINPITNQTTKYFYSGDPVTGQGWITGPQGPGEQRNIISIGPVNMNPGDTQYIVFAQIIARGTSNLNSITVLRQYAQEVKNYYNNCFSGVPIGIEPISQNIPDRFELYQNYPNPFNPKTILPFALPSIVNSEKSKVKLVVYNSLGQVVETLVNEELNAGTYEVEFDGTNLASGVYYYSLVVGNELIDTKKMVLIK